MNVLSKAAKNDYKNEQRTGACKNQTKKSSRQKKKKKICRFTIELIVLN